MMRRFTYCMVLLCISIGMRASEQGIVRWSPWIDINDQHVGPAIQTWIDYLNDSPDSLQDHACWPMKDRNDRYSFDPARAWVFQSKEFIMRYPPLIIGAEEIVTGTVLIKTLFQGVDSNGVTLPIALYRILAKKNNDDWYLEHVIDSMTSEWNVRTIGGMQFIMSPKHRYSSGTARKAMRFCDSLSALFDLHDIEDARYYIATSKEELASILGFDFFVSIPQGLTYPEKDWIFTSLDTEFHAHELIHLLFASFSSTHPFIAEGLSTWLGGSLGQDLKQLKKQLAIEYLRRPHTLTFKKVLEEGQKESLAMYTFGALICRQIFLLRGGSGLKQFLLESSVDTEQLQTVIANFLSIDTHEIDAFIKTALLDAPALGSD